MDRVYIISNYNYDPSEVINSLNADYIVCNQGDDSKIPEDLKKSIKYKPTKHTGHNLSDYLQYIIENYDNLPDEIGFIKGNIFPRHMQKDVFESRIQEGGFVPLYSDPNTYVPQYQGRFIKELVAQQVAPGIYLEIANDWYVGARKTGQYYPTLESLHNYLFKRELPKYIIFIPSACMITTKRQILRWDKEIYKNLYEAVTYDFFPVEAFHLERNFLYMFGCQKN